jgi:hypothetical protein
MKSSHLTYIAGATLFVPPLFWWLARGQDPSALYPLPALILIPALLGLKQLALIIPVGLFFVWNARLIDGDCGIPKRTFVLLVLATVGDAFWFAIGWQDGLAMQGAKYTYFVCAVNIAWIASLWLLFLRERKAQPAFSMNLLLHWMLFLWFAWYAFPFFGELP